MSEGKLVTEAEWSACADPTPMLGFLRGKASDRKLRLFACACCRSVWPSISGVFQDAIRVAEEHADGRATNAELGAAVSAVHRLRRKRNDLERAVYDAARSNGDAWSVTQKIAYTVARAAAPDPSPTAVGGTVNGQFVTEDVRPNADRLLWNRVFASQLRLEASLLHDVIGPLLFRSICIRKEALAWSDGIVCKLAQVIYDNRAFDRLPLLADALEEAGCDNQEILDHCRAAGEHVRGCWVVDLILGKS